MDRAGEPVGLDYPAVHHLLDLRTAEAEILGGLHHGDFLATLVFHAVLLTASCRRSYTVVRIPRSGRLPSALLGLRGLRSSACYRSALAQRALCETVTGRSSV